MKVLLVPLILLLLVACQPVAGLDNPIPVPPNVLAPTDPDGDGKYEDLNGNNRQDFADVVLFFNQMTWIATNQPVHLFDFNGNARIDFADVVSLFNDMGSSPPPARVVLSATVAPSDEDRVFRGDGVNLTVPGGALNQTSSVRVATVATPPAPPEGTSNLTVYDVTVGTQVRFMPGLVIEIPYTPAMIPPGTTPARVIQGIRWDEKTGTWRDVPTAVDTARGVVVLETDHLCVAGYAVQLAGTATLPPDIYVDDFVIHYDPSDDAAVQQAWKDWAPEIDTAKRLASYVGWFLEEGNTTFVKGQGFRKPVRSRFSLDNKIHVYIGDYYETSWNQFTKTITVSREPFLFGPGAKERLSAEMKHELFHAVQNAYISTGWMHTNRWWIEATAEYAGGSVDPAYPIDDTFFSKPLDTVNGKHEYQAASFIKTIFSNYYGAASFRSLWEATTTGWDADAAIQDWLKANRGATIGTVYAKLMVESQLLENRCSNVSCTRSVRQPVIDGAQQLGDTNVIPWDLPETGMGTVSTAFRVSTTENEEILLETLQSSRPTLPDDTHLARYQADGSTGEYNGGGIPFGSNGCSVRKGDTIIVYTAVRGLAPTSAFRDAIILTRPDVQIAPEWPDVSWGEAVDFTIYVENVPSGVPIQVTDGSGKVLATGTGSDSLHVSWTYGTGSPTFIVKTDKERADSDWYGYWYKQVQAHVNVI